MSDKQNFNGNDSKLVVPSESFATGPNEVFHRQLDGWIDEVQRQGMHRGETLVLVAPPAGGGK